MRILLSLLFFFCSTFASAATFYVVPTGSDYASGTQVDPWRTIQKAANVMVPGDTVLVSSGTYAERVQVTRPGTATAPITYQAQGAVGMRGFTIKTSYITVSGFEITNTNSIFSEGVGVYVEGRGNTVVNNFIHDLYWEGVWVYGGSNRTSATTTNNTILNNLILRPRSAGVMVEGVGNLVQGNDISHSLQFPPGAPSRPSADADGIRFFGSGHTIKNNYIHDIYASDPGNVDPHTDCFQTWGPATSMTFEGNLCHGEVTNLQAAMIDNSAAVVKNLTFLNNVFYNATRGIDMKASAKYKLMPGIIVVNNTFYNLSDQGVLLMSAPNSRVQNNLFYNVGSDLDRYLDFKDNKSTNLTVGYNAMYSSTGLPYGTPYPHDVWQHDPRVVDVTGHDFHLQNTSPLLDAGISVSGVTVDYDTVPRPQGTAYDIGAFEFFQ